MNNEPVAWMKKQYSPDIGEYIDYRENALDGFIPLYTHPVKTLTDEEIEEVAKDFRYAEYMDFARAILRKAQEK